MSRFYKSLHVDHRRLSKQLADSLHPTVGTHGRQQRVSRELPLGGRSQLRGVVLSNEEPAAQEWAISILSNNIK